MTPTEQFRLNLDADGKIQNDWIKIGERFQTP